VSRAPRALSKEQFRALTHQARDRRGRAAARDLFMFHLAGKTGARTSEFLAVRVRDVLLDHRPPLVRMVTLKQKGARQSWRDVYLEPKMAKRIARWIRHGLPRCLGRPVQPDDPLVPAAFAGVEPGHMTPRNARRIFKLYARRAQLEGVTLHSLRHYRGTRLYQATKDLKFTQDQLGHARLESTQIYLHHSPERVQGFLSDLEDELDG
jgi:integrase